ncbi:MAG: MerR family transcriptional regulator, partial [Deltaproteobacteria bacterium]
GVEIVLNMRERMKEMQREMQEFVEFVRKEMMGRTEETSARIQNALVRVGPPAIVRLKNSK